MAHARETRSEDLYYDVFSWAQILQSHLQQYEAALTAAGTDLPYSRPAGEPQLVDDYDRA